MKSHYREYDLCLNSGRLGYEACADIILAATAATPRPVAKPDPAGR